MTAKEVAPPSDAGGAAPLAVGDELPDAVSVTEPLSEPVVEADDEADREAEAAEEPYDTVLLLAALDAPEGDDVAEVDRVELPSPVEIRLSVLLAGRTRELEGEGSLTKSTTILISVH